jgi:hypothetical protein
LPFLDLRILPLPSHVDVVHFIRYADRYHASPCRSDAGICGAFRNLAGAWLRFPLPSHNRSTHRHCQVPLNNAVSTPRLAKPLPFDTIQNNAIPLLFLAVQFRGIAYRSMPCRSRSSPSHAMPLPCNSEAILGESPLWPCITLHP